MDEKRFLINDYLTGKYTITELAENYGVCRQTAHKFIKRFRGKGPAGLEERSRARRNIVNKTPKDIEKLILKTRKKYRHFGAETIIEVLSTKYPHVEFPARSTVNDILKRNGAIETRKRTRKAVVQKPIINPKAPGEVWATDFKGEFRMGNTEKCYPLTINDSYSRYIVGIKGLLSPNYKDTKAYFRHIFRENGLPGQILSDNGTPFAAPRAVARLTRLSAWWISLGITPINSQPGHPEQNGILERMHRELKKYTTKPPARNLQAQQRKLNRFRELYNEERPHHGLNKALPSSLYERSPRPFPEKIKPYEYPPEFVVRRVCRNGAIRWKQFGWVGMSTSIIEQNVGLEEIDDGLWRVWYCHICLGYFHEDKRRIEDSLGRFKRDTL